jgi:two-component system, NarL family, response regulator YdfI
MMRVLIAAHSPVARAGLEALLETSPRIEIVGHASDLASLPELVEQLHPDAVVLDTTGLDQESLVNVLSEENLTPAVAVVVLAEESSPAWTADALRAGVRAILPRDLSPQELVAATEAAAAGLVVLHPREVSAVVPSATTTSIVADTLIEPLTPREHEVLQMLAAGLANKEIAARLSISEHTVKFHVASILGKLGASSRTEAVSLALRHGLILL